MLLYLVLPVAPSASIRISFKALNRQLFKLGLGQFYLFWFEVCFYFHFYLLAGVIFYYFSSNSWSFLIVMWMFLTSSLKLSAFIHLGFANTFYPS